MTQLSVIIVNWNTKDLILNCLEKVYQYLPDISFETIVVDNASSDDSVAAVTTQFPQVEIIQNIENVGFAKANNQALARSKGRYALLLNTDAFITPGAIQSMLKLAEEKPQIGLVGAQLINKNGSFQASHTPFPSLWQEFLILSGLGRLLFGNWYPSRSAQIQKGPQKVDYVEGACLLVRREAYQQVGGLDESYFMYAEEVDWCYAMRQQGWQVWYQPQAKIIHLGGGSSQGRKTEREGDLYRSRVQFFRKHYGNNMAALLKFEIYILTAIKLLIHNIIRLLSRGRYGRSVISLDSLAATLREA